MTRSTSTRMLRDVVPSRIVGRGLRAARGVHLTLRALRDAIGKTQIDVAGSSGIDQGDVSRLESRADFEDCQVATLRRYVEALGGSLELVARFGQRRIALACVTAETATGSSRTPASKPSKRTGRKASPR